MRARAWRPTTACAVALICAARAVSGEPSTAADRARALLAQDRWRDALEEIAHAPAGSASDPALRSLRGEALYRAGRLVEADEVLTALCGQPAPPARALLTLGLLRSAAGKDAEGATLVDRALEIDPADLRILYWAASSAPTRALSISRLQAYLDRAQAEGEDADRVEAARGSLAFFRALGDRRTWVADGHPEHLEAPLRQLGGRGVTTGWVIDVKLGAGPPVPLLLDSGGGGLFLVERVANKHGFVPLASETAFGGGGGERHATKRGILPGFSIGALRFRDALANASPVEVEATGRYQGILGLEVFEGYRITFDLKRGRLILDATNPDPSGRPYWRVSGQLLVAAGARAGPEALFMIDTGAATSLLDLGYASSCEGATLSSRADVRGYGGAVRSARSVRGLRLVYDGREVATDRLAAADLSLRSRMAGVEVSGFLGLDVWSGGRLVIDTPARRVRWEESRAARRR